MTEKVGRNDPCPCGSGKKYKNCCQQTTSSSLGFRKLKFKAKVLNAGGQAKTESQEPKRGPMVDYNQLMERSFGAALHSHEDQPPLPEGSTQYLVSDNPTEDEK